jgi:hypothetical protein
MKNRVPLPPELEATKAAARRAIGAIRPAQVSTSDQATLYTAGRTAAGHALPPYYLVYFLLVELLEFPFWGRFEKVAWSVPIEFDGDLSPSSTENLVSAYSPPTRPPRKSRRRKS